MAFGTHHGLFFRGIMPFIIYLFFKGWRVKEAIHSTRMINHSKGIQQLGFGVPLYCDLVFEERNFVFCEECGMFVLLTFKMYGERCGYNKKKSGFGVPSVGRTPTFLPSPLSLICSISMFLRFVPKN